jgi:uncharacterized protein (TIGR02996 family)
MDEQAGILRAIVENPDDVTHRLVYADWLEDHEESRLAEFIRAQCALRPFLIDPQVETRYPVGVEIMDLQPELRHGLLRAFKPAYEELNESGQPLEVLLPQHFGFWVYRGFVEEVEVFGGKVLTILVHHARVIFPQVPLLRLTISPVADREARSSFAPYIYDVPERPVDLRAIRTLLKRPEIVRLRCLDLQYLRLGNALADRLLRAPSGFQPKRLLLNENLIAADMTQRLRRRFGEALVLTPYDENDIPF